MATFERDDLSLAQVVSQVDDDVAHGVQQQHLFLKQLDVDLFSITILSMVELQDLIHLEILSKVKRQSLVISLELAAQFDQPVFDLELVAQKLVTLVGKLIKLNLLVDAVQVEVDLDVEASALDVSDLLRRAKASELPTFHER